MDAEISNGDNQGSGESPAEKVEVAASTIKTVSLCLFALSKL